MNTAISPEDEFLIVAKLDGQPDRSWTRSTLSVAQHIADQAITRLGYTTASVVNTFGGHVSDPLYKVEKIGSKESLPKTCCMNVGTDGYKACGLPAAHWFRHDTDVCSYCPQHKYQCGDTLLPASE
jgi:hypothetical protein